MSSFNSRGADWIKKPEKVYNIYNIRVTYIPRTLNL